MTKHVIETVTFKLAAGVSDEIFLELVPSTMEFITKCDGFICRRLSKAEDGSWLDYLEWKSMELAKQASEAFMKQESLMPFMQTIDVESTQMQHREILVSAG